MTPLTVFAKTRMREEHEIERAQLAFALGAGAAGDARALDARFTVQVAPRTDVA